MGFKIAFAGLLSSFLIFSSSLAMAQERNERLLSILTGSNFEGWIQITEGEKPENVNVKAAFIRVSSRSEYCPQCLLLSIGIKTQTVFNPAFRDLKETPYGGFLVDPDTYDAEIKKGKTPAEAIETSHQEMPVNLKEMLFVDKNGREFNVTSSPNPKRFSGTCRLSDEVKHHACTFELQSR